MVKIILGCLFLALPLVVGCNDDGPEFRQGCRDVTSFPEFQECPMEAFMRRRVCSDYTLNIEGFNPQEVRLRLLIEDCEFPDCFTMDCEFTEQNRFTDEIIAIHNGVFFDLETFPGPGMVSVDGGDPVEYSAGAFVP